LTRVAIAFLSQCSHAVGFAPHREGLAAERAALLRAIAAEEQHAASEVPGQVAARPTESAGDSELGRNGGMAVNQEALARRPTDSLDAFMDRVEKQLETVKASLWRGEHERLSVLAELGTLRYMAG
jgi:hypothetical protein